MPSPIPGSPDKTSFLKDHGRINGKQSQPTLILSAPTGPKALSLRSSDLNRTPAAIIASHNRLYNDSTINENDERQVSMRKTHDDDCSISH